MTVIFDQAFAFVSKPFRLLSVPGDAPAGYGAGSVSARGVGGREAVGTFARLVARYGLKNVPTHDEVIAELPACQPAQ
jgi:hypothetical protein